MLSSNELHLWRTDLDLSHGRAPDLKEILSPDEVNKVKRFRYGRDRSRFIAARGTLRLILGRYLGCDPGVIRFHYEKFGKPGLEYPMATKDVRFNLSRSEGVALYAFAVGQEVGVDIECIREIPEMEQIADTFFTDEGMANFGALPGSGKTDAFYRLWTRKEALWKATGDGLSKIGVAPNLLAVSGRPVDRSSVSAPSRKRPTWSTWDIKPAEGFAGAVVVEGGCRDLEHWQFPI